MENQAKSKRMIKKNTIISPSIPHAGTIDRRNHVSLEQPIPRHKNASLIL